MIRDRLREQMAPLLWELVCESPNGIKSDHVDRILEPLAHFISLAEKVEKTGGRVVIVDAGVKGLEVVISDPDLEMFTGGPTTTGVR